MADSETIINAFERCFCEQHDHCPGCYQDGPGFGIDCRNALCLDVLALLKERGAEIRQLRLALDIVKGTCKGIAVETDEKFMGDL